MSVIQLVFHTLHLVTNKTHTTIFALHQQIFDETSTTKKYSMENLTFLNLVVNVEECTCVDSSCENLDPTPQKKKKMMMMILTIGVLGWFIRI